MSVKVIVCLMGEDPKVEEVTSGYNHLKKLVKGEYLEHQNILVGDHKVLAMWPENVTGKHQVNRKVPAQCPYLPETDFIVDLREGLPENYAKPGELGYFEVSGPFVLTAMGPKGVEVSLSEQAIKTYTALLTLPKCKRCRKNPLAYPGAVYCGAGCSARAEAGE